MSHSLDNVRLLEHSMNPRCNVLIGACDTHQCAGDNEGKTAYSMEQKGPSTDSAILSIQEVGSTDTRSTSRQDNRRRRSTVIRHPCFVHIIRKSVIPRYCICQSGGRGGRFGMENICTDSEPSTAFQMRISRVHKSIKKNSSGSISCTD